MISPFDNWPDASPYLTDYRRRRGRRKFGLVAAIAVAWGLYVASMIGFAAWVAS